MIQFGLVHNHEAVRRLLTDPRCYGQMANDNAPTIEEFRVKPQPDLLTILAEDDGEPIAIALLRIQDQCAEVHFCFSPSRWGHTRSTAEKFLNWIWSKTNLTMLIGPVPSYNRLALRLARGVGFGKITEVKNAGTKRGIPYDLIVMGLGRPER
jgi:RimJ/RimL family protein N-acetyltransferase